MVNEDALLQVIDGYSNSGKTAAKDWLSKDRFVKIVIKEPLLSRYDLVKLGLEQRIEDQNNVVQKLVEIGFQVMRDASSQAVDGFAISGKKVAEDWSLKDWFVKNDYKVKLIFSWFVKVKIGLEHVDFAVIIGDASVGNHIDYGNYEDQD